MKLQVLKLLYCVLVLLSWIPAKSQDIHFSQFFETPLLRNPALAGLFTGDLRLQSVYKTQWKTVSTAYQTVSLNGEYKLAVGKTEDFVTIGGQIVYDRAGAAALTATQILPAFNYHKSLSENRNSYLSVGFMAGIVQRSVDRSKITTNSQFNGTSYNGGLSDGESFAKSAYHYFDGTVGMSFNTQLSENKDDNMYLGVAYHHFNTAPNISFYSNSTLEMVAKWVYSGGVKISTADNSYITLEADHSKQGVYTENIASIIYSHKLDDSDAPKYLIHGGMVVRWKDAVIPVIKMETKPLSISLSYDINISKLAASTTGRGGFELGISYQKYINRDNSSKEAIRCPRF